MTTEEGNKIIADFMGYNWPNTNFYTPEEVELISEGELSKMKYHSSWNYLMSVVEKVESIKDEYHGHFGVYICSNSCTIQATNFRPDQRIPEPPHYFADWTLESKMLSTWTAVVYFIQWYNQTIKQ